MSKTARPKKGSPTAAELEAQFQAEEQRVGEVLEKKSKATSKATDFNPNEFDEDKGKTDNGATIEGGGPPTKAPPFKTHGEPDAWGFGKSTFSHVIMEALESGEFTRSELRTHCVNLVVKRDMALDPMRASNTATRKSSFSVFMSDVTKPVGTYHASRGLTLIENDEGKLSLDPKQCEAIKHAIAGGLMADLKGFTSKKHPDKINVILKKHKLVKG